MPPLLPPPRSILQNLCKTSVSAVLPPLAALSMHNAHEIMHMKYQFDSPLPISAVQIMKAQYFTKSQTTRRRYKNYLHQPRLDTLIEFITKSHNGFKVVMKSHLISYMLIHSEVLGNNEYVVD